MFALGAATINAQGNLATIQCQPYGGIRNGVRFFLCEMIRTADDAGGRAGQCCHAWTSGRILETGRGSPE